jgi:hypothetical protein
MQPANGVQTIVDKPLFDPTYLNIEYVFNKIAGSIQPTINFFTNPSTWGTIGTVSAVISIIFLSIIIFSLVRMYEIQVFDKEEIDHEIKHALAREKERDRDMNPRWKYILTLLESPNESDWRVAIIESDTLLEEAFRERGLVGNTMSELLEEAKMNGYSSIQSAWDAHLVRNKIAHEGLNYPITQVEVRRVVRLYQNVFEDLQVI